jgi:hypothetical protein
LSSAKSVLPAAKKYVSGKNRPSGLVPGISSRASSSASGRSSTVFFTSGLSRSRRRSSANVAPSTNTTDFCVTSPCVSLPSSCGSVMPVSTS